MYKNQTASFQSKCPKRHWMSCLPVFTTYTHTGGTIKTHDIIISKTSFSLHLKQQQTGEYRTFESFVNKTKQQKAARKKYFFPIKKQFNYKIAPLTEIKRQPPSLPPTCHKSSCIKIHYYRTGTLRLHVHAQKAPSLLISWVIQCLSVFWCFFSATKLPYKFQAERRKERGTMNKHKYKCVYLLHDYY
jgi:hypothetical protein